jgi:hypothetical protein
MRSFVLSLAALAALTSGCATLGNTPAQELAWERWGVCNRFTTITLERIEPDGRVVVASYEVDSAPFAACMQAAADAQIRRGASLGPQAILLVKNYGCQGGAM